MVTTCSSTTKGLLRIGDGPLCKNQTYRKVAGVGCLDCINNVYADKSSGVIHQGKGVLYKKYRVGDEVFSIASEFKPSGRGTKRYYFIPSAVATAHITNDATREQVKARYLGNPLAVSSSGYHARSRGDADAPAPRMVQRQYGSCQGIQSKCINETCTRSSHLRIVGLMCSTCALDDAVVEKNPIPGREGTAWLVTIPNTQFVGIAAVMGSGITFDEFAFLVYSHSIPNSPEWVRLKNKWIQRKEKMKSDAAASARIQRRQQEGENTTDQVPASEAFISKNVPTKITALFPGFDESQDFVNASKGRSGGVDGRLVRNEELGNLISKVRNPKVLVPNEDGNTGRSLFMKDFMEKGILYGTYQFRYSERANEWATLDVEQRLHILMKDLDGRMFDRIGGGQRVGTRPGNFQVGSFHGIGWVGLIKSGKLVLSSHMSGQMNKYYRENFGFDDDHFRHPDFDAHLVYRAYLKKRRLERKNGKIIHDETIREIVNELIVSTIVWLFAGSVLTAFCSAV